MKRAKKKAKFTEKKGIKAVSALDQYVIDRVKMLRKLKKITQADLSYKLDLSYAFIAQIESKVKPAHYNISHVNQIAKIL